MKLFLCILILVISVASGSYAQQTIQSEIPNIIEITFTSTASTSGNIVALPFTTPATYNTGATSSSEELKVSSNNNFNVSVKSNSANFTYTGNEIADNVMPVSKLALSVTSNATGGSVGSGFSNPAYKSLSTIDQPLITGGLAGSDQMFTIKYKATPGYNYAGGEYTVDVVFTATQP